MEAVLRIASGDGSLQDMYHDIRAAFASLIPQGRAGSAASIDALAAAFVEGSTLDDPDFPPRVALAFDEDAPPLSPIVERISLQYLKLFLRRLLLGSLDPTETSPTPFADMVRRLFSVYIGALFSKLSPHLRIPGEITPLVNLGFLCGNPECLPSLTPFIGVIKRMILAKYEEYQDLSASAQTGSTSTTSTTSTTTPAPTSSTTASTRSSAPRSSAPTSSTTAAASTVFDEDRRQIRSANTPRFSEAYRAGSASGSNTRPPLFAPIPSLSADSIGPLSSDDEFFDVE